MPEEAGDTHLTIDDMKATGLTSKSKWCIPLLSKPNGSVTIKWVKGGPHPEPQEHRTRVVKGTASPEWKETVKLVYLSQNSTISFEMFDKGLVHRHSYGIVRKTVAELLVAPRLTIPFLPHDAVLSITVKAQDTDSAASDNLRVAQNAILGLVEAPDTSQIKESPYAPLQDVVASLATFMDIADALAQIHPYVKVAWSIVSSVYNVVKDELERGEALRGLVDVMAMIYRHASFLKAEGEKVLSKNIVDTIERILQQTIECSLFIQEYSGKGFTGQAIKNSWLSTADMRIAEFIKTFSELRRNLDMGLICRTALVCVRLTRGVELLTLKSILDPAEIRWTGRPTCHPLTRTDIRCSISEWIVDPNASQVLWIVGPVGAGKSTLATTMANMYTKTGRLGAFVFFNRDVDKQSNPDDFIPTLAYELAKFHKGISEKIADATRDHGHIAQDTFDQQFQYLIHEPLENAVSEDALLASQGPIVVVIDALDECKDKQGSRKKLLKILATKTTSLPRVVRIIITSRPEPDIEAAFCSQHIKHIRRLDALPDDAGVRVYMESRLKEIAEANSLVNNWPGDDKLSRLVSLAGGLFIWASTACEYIEQFDANEALNELLQDGMHKGHELDILYNKALERSSDNERLRKAFRTIVGAISVAKNPMTTDTIDKLLELESPSKQLLTHFASVIHKADNGSVRVFHKSFSDFITNPNRCTNPAWFINVSYHEHRAALSCIARMKEEFETTPRHFAPAITPKVDYNEAVKYSCSYWIHHVIAVREDTERTVVAKEVHNFMKDHVLHWLEVRSTLGTSRSTPTMLEQLYLWAPGEGTDDLKSLAYDAYRFAVAFARTIARHPAMVAQVALPFTPSESKLYQLFHNSDMFPTVMGAGYQQKWPPTLRTFPSFNGYHVISVSFSHDMRNVVAISRSWGTGACQVQCWEMSTGTEAFPSVAIYSACIAQFSPNGTEIWIVTTPGSVYVLDVATGDLLSELPWHIWTTKASTSGRPIDLSETVLYSDHLTSSVATWRSVPSFSRASLSSDGRWAIFGTHPGQLYVIDRKAKELAYDILDTCSESRLNSGSASQSFRPLSIAVSPNNEMFAAGSGDGNIYMWHTESGKMLHHLEGHNVEPIGLTFSPKGDKLYSASTDGNVRIWDYTAGRSISSITVEGFRSGSIEAEVPVVAFSADGHIAWSTGSTVRIPNPTTGEDVGPIFDGGPGTSGLVWSISFPPDGRTFAIGTGANVQICDISGSVVHEVKARSRPSWSCCSWGKIDFTPSGLIVCFTRLPFDGTNSFKFSCSVTGRKLTMSPLYAPKSANDAGNSEDQTSLAEFYSDFAELSAEEKKWEARIQIANREDLTWTCSNSRIIYHRPRLISISNDNGTIRYEEDRQEIWRPPLEFGDFCCDIRPNFIALAINLGKEWDKDGRVVVVHIPESLVARNIQPA